MARTHWFSHRGRLLTAAALGIVGLGVGPLAPAANAAAPAIPATFFGTHLAGLDKAGARGWPQAPVGAIRLWDNGVAWNQVEVAPGVFDFTTLDALVAKARSRNTSVMLVLGQTPRFYSSNPSAPGFYGPGASAMPASKEAWQRYVTEMVVRNQTVWGHAVEFQVWNEANAVPYWTGTAAQMATLTQWTHEAVKAADPTAMLIAPAMVARLSAQQAYIKSFYSQRPGGLNVSAYVDALSFQLYPLAEGSPEDSMRILRQVRSILAKAKVRKPIFNTEINYGMVGGVRAGAPAKRISSSKQVANVARTYLLNAENGVSRVYWYSWDLTRMSNTALVGPNKTSLTSAGRAFGVVRSWIIGTRPAGCKAKRAVYTCTFRSGSGVRRAVWSTGKTVKVTMPKTTTSYSTADGKGHRTKAGKRIKVGQVPVLLRSKR